MLRLWGLLSNGLQNISTGLVSKGGKQEINSELHLCVYIRAVIFLCLLKLNLDQCDLGPMRFRVNAGKTASSCFSPTLTTRAQHSTENPAVSIATKGSFGCLVCFLNLTCTSHCQLSSFNARKKKLVPNGSEQDLFCSVSHLQQWLQVDMQGRVKT